MPKRTVVTTVAKLDVPEDKLNEYREAFDMFDKDHSGSISVDEISKIMKNFGNPMSKDEIREMIKDIDTSGDGELDFDEFVTLMQNGRYPVQVCSRNADWRRIEPCLGGSGRSWGLVWTGSNEWHPGVGGSYKNIPWKRL